MYGNAGASRPERAFLKDRDSESSQRTGKARDHWYSGFAFTLFVSATLLFIVEPMFGKMALPLLGGHGRNGQVTGDGKPPEQTPANACGRMISQISSAS